MESGDSARARWEREVLAPSLERAPERRPSFPTVSGRPIDRLYTAESSSGDDSVPGEFPYTRGLYPAGYRTKAWTIRQFAGFGSPEDTNGRYRRTKRDIRHGWRVELGGHIRSRGWANQLCGNCRCGQC